MIHITEKEYAWLTERLPQCKVVEGHTYIAGLELPAVVVEKRGLLRKKTLAGIYSNEGVDGDLRQLTVLDPSMENVMNEFARAFRYRVYKETGFEEPDDNI